LLVGEKQKLFWLGGAPPPATGAAGVLFKSIIQGRLKTVISGFPSRNPCFQMTSTKMGQGSVGFAREKYIGLFCFWVMSKIS